jgi:radical SAM protein with 4Fe4S-binding SPASM domain
MSEVRFEEINGYKVHSDLYYWDMPQGVSLEITSRCNLKCNHCFQYWFDFPKGDMADELLKDVLTQLEGVKEVGLSSAGESLISPQFAKVWNALKKRNFFLHLTTNALVLDRWIDEFVGRLDYLGVSLDAVTPEVYKRRRGVDPLPALNALKRLYAEKERRGENKPVVAVICVLNRENVEDVPNVVKFCSEAGIGEIYLYLQIFYSEEDLRKRSLIFRKSLYDKMLKETVKLANDLGIEVVHPGTFDGSLSPHPALASFLEGTVDNFTCKTIFRSATVTWNGYVQACCFADRLLMGNLRQESFKNIWNGTAYRKLRKFFMKKKVPGECHRCLFLQSLDINDIRAHFCPHREGAFYSDRALFPASEVDFERLDALYREGVSLLAKGNFSEAMNVLSEANKMDLENLFFEIDNALAVTLSLSGNTVAAREIICGLSYVVDEVVTHNMHLLS